MYGVLCSAFPLIVEFSPLGGLYLAKALATLWCSRTYAEIV